MSEEEGVPFGDKTAAGSPSYEFVRSYRRQAVGKPRSGDRSYIGPVGDPCELASHGEHDFRLVPTEQTQIG